MLQKYDILNALHKHYLIAVIRGKDDQEAIEVANHAYKGGISALEVTFSTPNAEEAIAQLSKNKDLLVGAGTVLDEMTARIAILKGAKYIVSPHFSKDIALACNRYHIPYLPGCGSVTEIMDALTSGVDVVKLFPGSLFGPGFIKDVHGPIPHVEIMPSGGVSLDNLSDWVKNGAFAVGIGSALTKGITEGDYSSVTMVAESFRNTLTLIKEG